MKEAPPPAAAADYVSALVASFLGWTLDAFDFFLVVVALPAIALADRSEYGLGASIYTNSLEHAMKAMEQVHAGTFWINDPLTDNDAGPFGGMRRSGIGRELGSEGIDDFRDSKHVHLDYVIGAKPYWYPYRYERPRE